MLWPDRQGEDQPSEETRAALVMVRRAMLVAAVAAAVVMALTAWRA